MAFSSSIKWVGSAAVTAGSGVGVSVEKALVKDFELTPQSCEVVFKKTTGEC
jgi:hypothetical protein